MKTRLVRAAWALIALTVAATIAALTGMSATQIAVTIAMVTLAICGGMVAGYRIGD